MKNTFWKTSLIILLSMAVGVFGVLFITKAFALSPVKARQKYCHDRTYLISDYENCMEAGFNTRQWEPRNEKM